MSNPDTILVTGYPSFTAKQLIAHIIEQRPQDSLIILCASKDERTASEWLDQLTISPNLRDQHAVVVGDVASMDLGLAGSEFSTLAEKISSIHHLAQVRFGGGNEADTYRTNVKGTRNLIAFAHECSRLRRLTHWSSAFVSGKRKGVILEDERVRGQGFHSHWEETKFEAEMLAAAANTTVPVTIVRPSIIVGDSQSGTFDASNPTSALLARAVSTHSGLWPLPAHPSAPVHLVPVDFVTRAALILSIDARGAGGTFHLTDSNPLPAKRVFELLAKHTDRGTPLTMVSPTLARTVMRTPGLSRLTRAPRAIIDALDRRCSYNARIAHRILRDYNVHCPAFDEYVEALVAYAHSVNR